MADIQRGTVEIDEALPKGGNVCVKRKEKGERSSFFFFFCWPLEALWLMASGLLTMFGRVNWMRFSVRYCVCVPGGLCCCLSFRVLILEDNECARFGTDRPSRPAYPGWVFSFLFIPPRNDCHFQSSCRRRRRCVTMDDPA